MISALDSSVVLDSWIFCPESSTSSVSAVAFTTKVFCARMNVAISFRAVIAAGSIADDALMGGGGAL